METVNVVVSIIMNVGFPIAMCLLLWWDKRTVIKQNSEALEQMNIAVTALIATVSTYHKNE